MLESNFLTAVGVFIFAGTLLFRVRLLSRKTLGHFTLLQVIYLVLIPGFIFPMLFAYMRSITTRPFNTVIVIPDGFLLNITLLAMLFTYGGIAIHAVTKMLDEVIDDSCGSEVVNRNNYFHYTFSHNLTYSGIAVVILGLTLLDMNHLSQSTYGFWSSLLKGVLLAITLLMAIYNYHPYATSRWSDLKTFFLVIWMGFMAVLYGINKVDPTITEYQLLLPALISFALMSSLSFLLILRRLRHGWRIYFSRKRLRRLMHGVDE